MLSTVASYPIRSPPSPSNAHLFDLQESSTSNKAHRGVVDDKTLNKLLDRSHLEQNKAAPYPPSGMGYEVVQAMDSSTLLQGVNC